MVKRKFSTVESIFLVMAFLAFIISGFTLGVLLSMIF